MKGSIIRLVIVIPIIFLSMFLIVSLPMKFYKEYQGIIHFGMIVIFLLSVFWVAAGYKSKDIIYKKQVLKEKIPDEFERIYKDLYNNHIHSLEKMRKQVRWRIVVQYIAMFTFFIGCIFGESKGTIVSTRFDTQMGQIGGIGLFIAIFFIIWNREYMKKYTEAYKKEIVSAFINLINNQLDYNPEAAEPDIIQADYKKADFDDKVFNRFYPDDYLEGFVDEEMFIKMCDLHIQYHTKSGKHSNTVEIFQGIFAHTRCGKDIGTYVKISKNKTKILNKLDRVEMDSEEFEKYFDIYSGNKIVAMQLLTSDIMEDLTEFYNKYQLDYEIVFRNNTIYMRFFTGAMFEPKIFGNSMDKQLLFIYFCIFKFIVDISKKVNKILQEIEV